MRITRVVLDYSNPEEDKTLIATATVDFDFSFRIKDIKVRLGQKGPYLVFPQKVKASGFVTYPTKDELRQEILNRILEQLKEGKGYTTDFQKLLKVS